MNLYHKQQCKI